MSQQQAPTSPHNPLIDPPQQLKTLDSGNLFKVNKKINQMQNKVYFFEGQLNPLSIENKTLKDQVIQLQKSVILSADVLRKLLVVQKGSNQKLKLQMASIQQISGMIKEDWEEMVKKNSQLNHSNAEKSEKIQVLFSDIDRMTHQYDKMISEHEQMYIEMENKLKETIIGLGDQIVAMTEQFKREKQEIQLNFAERIKTVEQLQQQLKKEMEEMTKELTTKEKINVRLKQQIAQNLQDFEKSKQNMKQIYEQLMEEKLQEMKESYEYMLDIKAEQHQKILQEAYEKQQNYLRKIAEKHSEISHLNGMLDRSKQQIGKCKEQIWEKQMKLDQNSKQLKQLQKELFTERSTITALKTKMDAVVTEYKRQIRQLKEKQLEEVKKYKQLIGNSQEELKKKEAEKNKLMAQLSEKEEENAKVKRKLRENEEKFQQELKLQKSKVDDLEEQIGISQKMFNKIITEANNKVKAVQNQLEETIKKHQKDLKVLKSEHQTEIEKLDQTNKAQLQRMRNENEDNVRKIMRDYERTISDIQVKNNQYVRQLVIQQNNRLREQETALKTLKQESEKLIGQLKEGLADKTSALKILEEQFKEVDSALKNHKKQTQKLLEMERSKMNAKIREQIELFQKTIKQKQQQFNLAIKSKELELQQQEKNFKSQMDLMKTQMMNEINMLKQTNALEQVESKYERLLSQMQERNRLQLLKKHQEMMSNINKLEQTNQSQIQRLNQEHNQQLIDLSKKLQFDISQLNEDLLDEKKAHEFSVMSKQEKINYLLNRINLIKTKVNEKDEQIINLQLTINEKNRELAKIDEIVAQKIKRKQMQMEEQISEIRDQCSHQIKQEEANCRIKIKKIQVQRVQHAQELYSEFEEIKRRNQLQLNRLQNKYQELERLFEERPSRAEDLNKIKQLILERARLDQQIQESKKKVGEANEIVRYLNLQLQNYKESYDIFGPNDQYKPKEHKKTINDQESENSDIKSYIDNKKRVFHPLLLEDSEKSQPLLKYKIQKQNNRRFTTQQSEQKVSAVRLLPVLKRSKSIVPEDITSQRHSEKNSQLLQKKDDKARQVDKSNELRQNAQIFLCSINRKDVGNPITHESKNAYKKRTKNQRYHKKQIKIKEQKYIMRQLE